MTPESDGLTDRERRIEKLYLDMLATAIREHSRIVTELHAKLRAAGVPHDAATA